MSLTYINFNENGGFDFDDGFCCGTLKAPTREEIVDHCKDGWYDERDVWIGVKRNAKARYTREQWLKIADEIESGNVKPGLRIGWFCKSDKKAADKVEKFRAAMRKIGYDVDDRIVEDVSLIVKKISRNKKEGK